MRQLIIKQPIARPQNLKITLEIWLKSYHCPFLSHSATRSLELINITLSINSKASAR